MVFLVWDSPTGLVDSGLMVQGVRLWASGARISGFRLLFREPIKGLMLQGKRNQEERTPAT